MFGKPLLALIIITKKSGFRFENYMQQRYLEPLVATKKIRHKKNRPPGIVRGISSNHDMPFNNARNIALCMIYTHNFIPNN
jgi:hypothetical protein